MRKRKSQGRKITSEQPPSLLHRSQQVTTLKNSNFHWSRYKEPLVQPSSLSLHSCVMSTGRNRALNLPYLSNVPTNGCLLLGLRGGSRGLGINEVITVRVPCIVYKCKGWSGQGGACLPVSSGACILPQPSTCSVISTQQITLSGVMRCLKPLSHTRHQSPISKES